MDLCRGFRHVRLGPMSLSRLHFREVLGLAVDQVRVRRLGVSIVNVGIRNVHVGRIGFRRSRRRMIVGHQLRDATFHLGNEIV